VHMLRTDSRQHKRLIQIRRERSLTKAQLYVTDHFIDKEKDKDKNSCLNGQSESFIQPKDKIYTGHINTAIHNCSSQTHPSSKREPVHSSGGGSGSKCHHHHHSHHNHRHHHSNKSSPNGKVTTHKDGHTYEQILSQTSSDSSTTSCDRTCQTTPQSSVIVWGTPDHSNSADLV